MLHGALIVLRLHSHQRNYRFASSKNSGFSIPSILTVLLFLKCIGWYIRKCAEQTNYTIIWVTYHLWSFILFRKAADSGHVSSWLQHIHHKEKTTDAESSPFVDVIQWSIMQGKWLFFLVLFYFLLSIAS